MAFLFLQCQSGKQVFSLLQKHGILWKRLFVFCSSVGDDAHIVPYIELSQYGTVAQKYMNGIIGINKCVIMPNHIHMIIVIDERENGTMWADNGT
ncbi:MAG: hypothetical protein RR978_09245, partial [Oscillospiraceae bacterium]